MCMQSNLSIIYLVVSCFFKLIRRDFALHKNMKVFSDMFCSVFHSTKNRKLYYLSRICFCVLYKVFIFCYQINSELFHYYLLKNLSLTDLEKKATVCMY